MMKILLSKIKLYLGYKFNLEHTSSAYLENVTFYGQFSPSVDKVLFTKYFLTKKNGFFIECGAFDGITENSCKFFEEFKGWKGINVEPVPYVYDKLVTNRPNSININTALSNYEGITKFKQPIHPHFGRFCNNGSIEHKAEHLQWLKDIDCEFEDIEVPVTTFSKMLKQYNIKEVDLFVLDVEGHEMTVLEDFKNLKIFPKVLFIETGHTTLFEIIEVLKKFDYTYQETSFVNSIFTHSSYVK